MSIRRPQKPISLKHSILIVCEGSKTEINYFANLVQAQNVRDRLAVSIETSDGGGASATIKKASALARIQGKRLEAYDEVWCVFDVETSDNLVQVEKALKEAEAKKIQVAISNPCFEIWLIAHFEIKSRAYINCDGAENILNNHWKQCFQSEYQKNHNAIYSKVKDRLPIAIVNAKDVLEKHHQNSPCQSSNSSTTVYRLVNRLLGNAD